jgi:hypothetical protein
MDKPRGANDPGSTRWTLISQARAVDPELRRTALDELLRIYRPALEAHLRGRWRLDPDVAEEIVQGFLVKKVLERQLLATADPAKGRLRALMLRSLENYYHDVLRKPRPQQLGDESSRQPADRAAALHDAFDVAWAQTVLLESLRRMCEDCRKRGREKLWSLFELRVVAPILTGAAPMDYAQLVERLSIASPEKASNLLVTAMRQFRQVLKRVVEEYAEDEEIESELVDLHTILVAAGPLGLAIQWRPELPCSALAKKSAQMLSEIGSSPGESTHVNLSKLFNAEPERDELWDPSELQLVLDDHLKVPLVDVLAELNEDTTQLVALARKTAGSSDEPLKALGDLFAHPAPPIELLDAVKRWGRRATRDEASSLPSEITSLVYFAAIAAALVRHNQRISKSDDATLQYGFDRVLRQPCRHERLVALIRAAAKQIGSE